MAIKLSTTTPFGIDLPNAYIKVTFFSGDSKYVQYHVRTYADAAARHADKQHLDEKNFSFDYKQGQGDVLIACYNNLMAQPEYAGALAV